MALPLTSVHSVGVSAAIPSISRLSPSGRHAEPMRPAPPRTAPTYISPGIRVRGTITAAEDLYIDGDVRGSLSAPGHRLTVGELAYIDADTMAREVVVYGALQGGLCAFERLEIKKHASVAGDVATATLVIEDGAHFKGVISAEASPPITPEKLRQR
jgi:cytoskeletal protein CcmA (bactofilin family)